MAMLRNVFVMREAIGPEEESILKMLLTELERLVGPRVSLVGGRSKDPDKQGEIDEIEGHISDVLKACIPARQRPVKLIELGREVGLEFISLKTPVVDMPLPQFRTTVHHLADEDLGHEWMEKIDDHQGWEGASEEIIEQSWKVGQSPSFCVGELAFRLDQAVNPSNFGDMPIERAYPYLFVKRNGPIVVNRFIDFSTLLDDYVEAPHRVSGIPQATELMRGFEDSFRGGPPEDREDD